MRTDLNHHDNFNKIRRLINEVPACMFCSMENRNHMHSRPMETIDVDEKGAIWFFTNEYSEKVDEISIDDMVCLNYASPEKQIYMCITGHAELIRDSIKIDELWDPKLTRWFSAGKDDSQLALLKIKPDRAYYWDEKTGKMTSMFERSSTGEIIGKEEAGKHGAIHLESRRPSERDRDRITPGDANPQFGDINL